MADAKQQQLKSPVGVWPTVKPFVNGGASGMLATCVIQPIDMIKVPIVFSLIKDLSSFGWLDRLDLLDRGLICLKFVWFLVW